MEQILEYYAKLILRNRRAVLKRNSGELKFDLKSLCNVQTRSVCGKHPNAVSAWTACILKQSADRFDMHFSWCKVHLAFHNGKKHAAKICVAARFFRGHTPECVRMRSEQTEPTPNIHSLEIYRRPERECCTRCWRYSNDNSYQFMRKGLQTPVGAWHCSPVPPQVVIEAMRREWVGSHWATRLKREGLERHSKRSEIGN